MKTQAAVTFLFALLGKMREFVNIKTIKYYTKAGVLDHTCDNSANK